MNDADYLVAALRELTRQALKLAQGLHNVADHLDSARQQAAEPPPQEPANDED